MKAIELADEEFEHFTVLLQDDMITADIYINSAESNDEQIEIAERHYRLSKSILEKL